MLLNGRIKMRNNSLSKIGKETEWSLFGLCFEQLQTKH